MTDRDTFAAAALTGLLADDGDRVDPAMPNFTARAYEWADAMLRERERTPHDASPEAGRPSVGAEEGRVRASAFSTGNTPSEAEIDALEFVVEEGRIASMDDYGILRSLLVRVRPEWEAASQPELPPRRCYSCGCTVDDWFYRQFCRSCYDRGVR
jgi:hypothetical protein